MKIHKFNQFLIENSSNHFSELENILLSIGGNNVVKVYEEDLDKLIDNGESEIFDEMEHELIKMNPSKCHQNVTDFYKNFSKENSEDEIGIITGWALSDDIWYQHSWICLWEDNILIETTELRDKYYGIIIKGKDIMDFLDNN